MKPGDDVWVECEGREWPGEVEKIEHGGFIRCKVHFDDPSWDFGRGGASIMPEQTVAIRNTHVRTRECTF